MCKETGLDVGLGAGWFALEYNMYGIPFPAPAQRIRELDEACQVLKLLWTQEVSDFEGKYYTLQGARHEPKPVQEPSGRTRAPGPAAAIDSWSGAPSLCYTV